MEDMMSACAASGSKLVFTYVEQGALGSNRASSSVARLQGAFATAKEPWLSGFDPSQLAEDLASVGLVLVEDLNGTDAKSRYCGDPRDDLLPVVASHIARAARS
jgi:O-methyltransferase involved in polyketide biosynthesis